MLYKPNYLDSLIAACAAIGRAMKTILKLSLTVQPLGDRIYTDIKSGINAGAVSVLVMSGETTEEILNASPERPDLVLGNAGEIIPFL